MNHIMRKSWRIAIYRDGEKERQVKSNMNLNTRNVKLHKINTHVLKEHEYPKEKIQAVSEYALYSVYSLSGQT